MLRSKLLKKHKFLRIIECDNFSKNNCEAILSTEADDEILEKLKKYVESHGNNFRVVKITISVWKTLNNTVQKL